MAFDWEGILGAEGSSLQSAYDDALDYFDRIEHGYSRPKTCASDYRAPEFCDDDGLPECNGSVRSTSATFIANDIAPRPWNGGLPSKSSEMEPRA